MKKTIQINIGGRHFHIDEDAFQKLNHYLESLKAHFSAEGETGKEIMEDIEQRIAELLEKKITTANQSVTIDDVNEAILVLGKVEDFDYRDSARDTREQVTFERRNSRRFFRDEEHNYVGGVASGLAAYFDIDPIWIRLIFIALTFLDGLGLLIYIILWIVVPCARTTTEKLQMRGMPVTLSTIRESVNEEYHKVKDNIHQFSGSERTRNAVQGVFHAIGLIFIALFKFIIGLIGVILLVTGTIFLATMIMVMLGFTNLFGHFHFWNPHFEGLFMHASHFHLLAIAVVIAVLIPIIALIYGGIKILFNIRTRHPVLTASLLVLWIVAVCASVSLIAFNGATFSGETSGTQTTVIEHKTWPRLYIEVRDNSLGKRITEYSMFDQHFNYNEDDKSLYAEPHLSLMHSYDGDMSLSVEKHVHNVELKNSQNFIDKVQYNWEQKDSVIYIDRYMNMRDDNFWLFPRVEVTLQIPENQVVILSSSVCDLENFDEQFRYCNDSALAGKPSIMTAEGLTALKIQPTARVRNK